MLTLLLVSIFTLAFNTQTVKSEPTTIIVPDDYSTIQEAINAANLGDTVYVSAGTYYENVVLNKSVSFIGESKSTTIINGGGVGNVIAVTASHVNVSGFTLEMSGADVWDYSGIILLDCSSNNIVENNISNNSWGICLKNSSDNEIGRNSISCNKRTLGSHGGGILLWHDSNSNMIIDNAIIDNLYNSVFIASNQNTIVGNTIANNAYVGIRADYGSNLIYHNNFINNTIQVSDQGYLVVNTWDNGYPSGGNYWSDYMGVDVDGDGIGDTPYVIDENDTDRYPLMHPWSSLPVHNINTGLGYATIQEAINANETLDGHTIFVETGTYYENMVVNKTICLIGEDKGTTVIDGMQKGHVINVAADNITITNFTIANSSLGSTDSGIYLYGINGCNITQNNIINNNIGVYLAWASNNNISSNNITENSWCGIYLSYSSNNNVISLNNLEANNHYGIGLLHSSNINDIHGNNMTKNYYGIGIGSFSSYNVIFGNDIANNHQGIGLYEFSTNNVISENNITANNQYGIYLRESSNNRVYHNNINNTYQVYLTDSFNNTWDNGCEGNYWSNYDGTDLDGDGIGDTYLPCEGVDYYPLMNPYWLPGDVNHDLKIDIYDVVRITGVYGSQQGDPNWNCHSDIAEPYGIINIYDVITCTKDYRKEYTP